MDTPENIFIDDVIEEVDVVAPPIYRRKSNCAMIDNDYYYTDVPIFESVSVNGYFNDLQIIKHTYTEEEL